MLSSEMFAIPTPTMPRCTHTLANGTRLICYDAPAAAGGFSITIFHVATQSP